MRLGRRAAKRGEAGVGTGVDVEAVAGGGGEDEAAVGEEDDVGDVLAGGEAAGEGDGGPAVVAEVPERGGQAEEVGGNLDVSIFKLGEGDEDAAAIGLDDEARTLRVKRKGLAEGAVGGEGMPGPGSAVGDHESPRGGETGVAGEFEVMKDLGLKEEAGCDMTGGIAGGGGAAVELEPLTVGWVETEEEPGAVGEPDGAILLEQENSDADDLRVGAIGLGLNAAFDEVDRGRTGHRDSREGVEFVPDAAVGGDAGVHDFRGQALPAEVASGQVEACGEEAGGQDIRSDEEFTATTGALLGEVGEIRGTDVSAEDSQVGEAREAGEVVNAGRGDMAAGQP